MASEPAVVSFAERLKQRRDELGLSQAQAARELDVARTAYRLWEMEAARPSPDRWRLISRWLGISISVTTMLLAEDLASDAEQRAGEVTAVDFGQRADAAADKPANFFTRAYELVSDAVAIGHLTQAEADELRVVLERIETAQSAARQDAWEMTEIRKTLKPDDEAPRKARRAVEATAEGLPDDVVHTASLLTTELVTNSIRHGATERGPIEVSVEAGTSRLRVEVAEPAGLGEPTLTQPSETGGYGLTLVDQLSDSWGSEETDRQRRTWFELALTAPGAQDRIRQAL
jgi:transcriptional regulator with XRE-family HTH domain